MKETILNRLSDEEFLAIASKSNSISNLCFNLGYKSSSTKTSKLIRKRLDELNFDLKLFLLKEVSVLNNLTLLEKAVRDNYTYSDVIRVFNLALTGGNQRSLKKYIEKFNLDIKHFDSKKYFVDNSKIFWNSKDIFVINSPVETVTVRRRILKEKLIPYQCNKCHNSGVWCNEAITLQLEHKNGDNKDHRLENLEFLCPNCHSQTLTYGGKNIKLKTEKFTSYTIPVIKADITRLTKEINNYQYIDDILTTYRVKKCKLNREKLIKMLSDLNHQDVNIFLCNLKINNNRINFPPAKELLEEVNKSNYCAVARKLNCSDNAIRKYLKKHNLI